MNGDLELQVSLEDARRHMQELIADRKQLSSQIGKLKDKLLTPSSKVGFSSRHQAEGDFFFV